MFSPAVKCQVLSQLAKPRVLKGFHEYYNSLLLFISQNISDWLLSVTEKEDAQAAFVFLTCYLTSESYKIKHRFLNSKWPVHQTTMTFSARYSFPGKASMQFLLFKERQAPFKSSTDLVERGHKNGAAEASSTKRLSPLLFSCFHLRHRTPILTALREETKSFCTSLRMGIASVKAEHDCFN